MHDSRDCPGMKRLETGVNAAPSQAAGEFEKPGLAVYIDPAAHSFLNVAVGAHHHPTDMNGSHDISNFAGVGLFQGLLQIGDGFDQSDSSFSEPFRKIIAIVFLPLALAVDNQDLMKLG